MGIICALKMFFIIFQTLIIDQIVLLPTQMMPLFWFMWEEEQISHPEAVSVYILFLTWHF